MKLESGMYVRTLNGMAKIDKIQDNVMKDTKGYFHYGDFVKASYNRINILEVEDYVNGKKIINVILEDICGNEILDNQHIFTKDGEIFENEIETIVTHEQMEQMAFKVEE